MIRQFFFPHGQETFFRTIKADRRGGRDSGGPSSYGRGPRSFGRGNDQARRPPQRQRPPRRPTAVSGSSRPPTNGAFGGRPPSLGLRAASAGPTAARAKAAAAASAAATGKVDPLAAGASKALGGLRSGRMSGATEPAALREKSSARALATAALRPTTAARLPTAGRCASTSPRRKLAGPALPQAKANRQCPVGGPGERNRKFQKSKTPTKRATAALAVAPARPAERGPGPGARTQPTTATTAGSDERGPNRPIRSARPFSAEPTRRAREGAGQRARCRGYDRNADQRADEAAVWAASLRRGPLPREREPNFGPRSRGERPHGFRGQAAVASGSGGPAAALSGAMTEAGGSNGTRSNGHAFGPAAGGVESH